MTNERNDGKHGIKKLPVLKRARSIIVDDKYFLCYLPLGLIIKGYIDVFVDIFIIHGTKVQRNISFTRV